jgi:deoxyribonuclease-4
LHDFYALKQKLDALDRIRFCIDTAHAHAYGYDIATPENQKKFIQLIDDTVGIDMVELIHLNDATYPLASRIDKHAVPGKGTIGINALHSFAMHPKLTHIPLILELPHLSQEEDEAILRIVREWGKVLAT